MSKKIIITFMALLTLCSCSIEKGDKQKGKETTMAVNVKDFTEIDISGSFNVYFTQDTATSVKVKGYEKYLKNVKITSNGKTLSIGTHKSWKNFSFFYEDIDVYITSPNIRGISIAGSGEFSSNNKIDTDRMYISVAGSGEVDINDIICDELQGEIAGSGDIDIKRITTQKASLSIAGSGDIKFDNARIDSVSCEIAGSGDIKIKGDVKHCEKDIAGSGSVEIY
ncbi:MAG: head GIN domain-containing protein [Prevotella sp.]